MFITVTTIKKIVMLIMLKDLNIIKRWIKYDNNDDDDNDDDYNDDDDNDDDSDDDDDDNDDRSKRRYITLTNLYPL